MRPGVDYRGDDPPRRPPRASPASIEIVAIAAVVLLGVFLAVGFYAFGAFFSDDSSESSYEYEVTVAVDRPTEDVVVYVPVPAHDGEPVVVDLPLWSYHDGVGDYDFEVVETAHGPMMRVEINEIVGRDYVMLEARVESDRTIDTRAPHGTEPVLIPMNDLTDRECFMTPERFEDLRCYSFTSVAYVERGGSSDATLDVHVRHSGGNEWWTLGWGGNRYETNAWHSDRTVDPDGEWVELEGEHDEGHGSYGGVLPPPPR